jgi:hypothetical protein
MTYFRTTKTSRWYGHDGQNASATCLPGNDDEEGECVFEVTGLTLREATRRAEDHAAATGHSVEVERALFRVIGPAR